MDETAVWFDMVLLTTIDTRGAKSVCLKTNNQRKAILLLSFLWKLMASN